MKTISDLRFVSTSFGVTCPMTDSCKQSNDGDDLIITVKGSQDNSGWIGRFRVDRSGLR